MSDATVRPGEGASSLDVWRALEWAMAPNPRHEGRHRTEPRCHTFMPTDADCTCGYDVARRVLEFKPLPTAGIATADELATSDELGAFGEQLAELAEDRTATDPDDEWHRGFHEAARRLGCFAVPGEWTVGEAVEFVTRIRTFDRDAGRVGELLSRPGNRANLDPEPTP